jgi:hypothetical protein
MESAYARCQPLQVWRKHETVIALADHNGTQGIANTLLIHLMHLNGDLSLNRRAQRDGSDCAQGYQWGIHHSSSLVMA